MKNIIKGLQNKWIAFLFSIMGVLLIIFPDTFKDLTPCMLGIGLIVKGIIGVVTICRSKDQSKAKVGDIVVSFVLGAATLFHNANAIGAIGAIWAMSSLHDVAEEITEAFENKHFPVVGVIFSALSIFFAVLLLFDPFEHFSFHVVILGLEMVTSVFIGWGNMKFKKKEAEVPDEKITEN